MTDHLIIVIGKKSVRATEIPHLETFGRIIHACGKQLITTTSEGAAFYVNLGYSRAGGTPQYLTNADYERLTQEHPVIAFTDAKYMKQLEDNAPYYKTADWCLIHNPKATAEAAAFIEELLNERETGTSS